MKQCPHPHNISADLKLRGRFSKPALKGRIFIKFCPAGEIFGELEPINPLEINIFDGKNIIAHLWSSEIKGEVFKAALRGRFSNLSKREVFQT